jgi:hypothetical protein
MASLTVGEVVRGPGVNSQGSPVGEAAGLVLMVAGLMGSWDKDLRTMKATGYINQIDTSYDRYRFYQ